MLEREREDAEDTDDDDAVDSPAEAEVEPGLGPEARLGRVKQHKYRGLGGAGSFLRTQQQNLRPPASLRAGWITPSVPRSHDYRSEGEQPSTERNGNRRSVVVVPPALEEPQQDSFRLSRMPKRGGRKRLRIVRSVRRKIRVSSYCVSRELKTLQLLRWLEKQPNRRLSQSIRAEGGSMPQGPVGAATVTASAAAVPTATRAAPEQRRPPERLPGMDDSNGSGGRALTIDQLEWMDSLYIDVIHSTTDLRGGIRKARALARRAWEDVPEEDEEGEDYEREGEEEEDDDVVTHKDVIYFPYGAVVFWGCSEAEVRTMAVFVGVEHLSLFCPEGWGGGFLFPRNKGAVGSIYVSERLPRVGSTGVAIRYWVCPSGDWGGEREKKTPKLALWLNRASFSLYMYI